MSRICLTLWIFFCLIGFCGLSIAQTGAQSEIELPKTKERADIGILNKMTVSGRLRLEAEDDKQVIYMAATDKKTYFLTGDLVEQIKPLVSELGDANIFSLEGIFEGGIHSTSCHNDYSIDKDGNKNLATRCVSSYKFKVTKIIESKKSDEALPEPDRDKRAEADARKIALSQMKDMEISQTGEIKGIIRAANLKSPIKSVKIEFINKDDKPETKVFMVTSNTRIVKKVSEDTEPILLGPQSLEIGKEIFVVYTRTEKKTEALFITVLN